MMLEQNLQIILYFSKTLRSCKDHNARMPKTGFQNIECGNELKKSFFPVPFPVAMTLKS